MKTLLKTDRLISLTIIDFWETESDNDFNITGFEGTKEEFIETYENSSVFFDWETDEINLLNDVYYQDFMYELNQILQKTKIKEGFCEILDGGWKRQRGISKIFTLSASNLMSVVGLDGDASLEFKKEGQQLYITRYSHDEPMGATIKLHSSKKYDKIYKEIMA